MWIIIPSLLTPIFTLTLRTCDTSSKSHGLQEITDSNIYQLSSSSAKVAREMEESIHMQKEIAIGQQDSLEYQRQLAVDGSHLSQAVEASKGQGLW